MSTTRDERSLSTTLIKLEHDSDDGLIGETLSQSSKRLSTENVNAQPTALAYKGKIEVTSKGRRKIFDGVRWQILCRRPECRKQTNKKSLCITHYKEEYETKSWSSNVSSFPSLSYHPSSQTNNQRRTRSDVEDQNNTISTSNMIDADDQFSLRISPSLSINEGQIKFLHNGQRFILKDNKWQPLCKYDNICRGVAKYELLCAKHFQITQQKQRNPYSHRTSHTSLKEAQHRPHGLSNPVRINTDYRISSSSVTDQFDINSNDGHCEMNECGNTGFSSKTSTHSNVELNICSPSKDATSQMRSTKLPSSQQNEQSVQTDLSIPVCCIVRQEAHSLFSSCIYDTSTSSTKHEPQYDAGEYS